MSFSLSFSKFNVKFANFGKKTFIYLEKRTNFIIFLPEEPYRDILLVKFNIIKTLSKTFAETLSLLKSFEIFVL